MPHRVDGFDLAYEFRGSWKVTRHERGQLLDIIPVIWAHQYRYKEGLVQVGYKDRSEMNDRMNDRTSFAVALARAVEPDAPVISLKDFTAVFEVMATGVQISSDSIEAKFIQRLTASRAGLNA